MSKKLIFTLTSIAVLMVMILTACKPAATPAPAQPAAPAAKEMTVAGVVFQDDQFMKSMVQGYVDAGTKYGIKVVTANTNNDQAKEAELIQTYIAQ
jgi:simple sugar transport system substrate-binding protein/ribose transport system substrate-binding protein